MDTNILYKRRFILFRTLFGELTTIIDFVADYILKHRRDDTMIEIHPGFRIKWLFLAFSITLIKSVYTLDDN